VKQQQAGSAAAKAVVGVDSRLATAPKATRYPDDVDVRNARAYGFFDDTHEPYTSGDIADMYTLTLKPGMPIEHELTDKMRTVPTKSGAYGNTFARAQLAANRNAIASLGFDPARTTLDANSQDINLHGAYSPKYDRIYARTQSPQGSVIVHESIHRGLEKLFSAQPELYEVFKKLPGSDASEREEYLVRWLMSRDAGNPEAAISREGQQPMYDVYAPETGQVEREANIKKLEDAAAYLNSQRHPRRARN